MNVVVNNIMRKIQRIIYFASVVQSYLFSAQDKKCPFCGAGGTSEVANKLFFLKLFRCNQCKLMFRFPKDTMSTGAAEDYRLSLEEKGGYLPNSKELRRLKEKKFKQTIYDISGKIEQIKKYIGMANVLDYGASWGYNLWQFLGEGFSGVGYEISEKRAAFGEQCLGLEIIHDPETMDKLEAKFDVIFANHVLEHCQDIKKELDRIRRLLKAGGLFVIYVPDCTDIENEKWRNAYAFGQRHALAFSLDFFKNNLPSLGFSILEIEKGEAPEYAIGVIARKQ